MKQYTAVPEQLSGMVIYPGQFSVIIPEESHNYIVNPSFELYIGGANYFWVAGAAAVRVVTQQRRGAYGCEITPAAGNSGGYYSPLTTVAGEAYTFSLDFYGNVGDQYQIFVADNAGNALSQVYTFDGRGFWTRPSVTYVDNAGAADRRAYFWRVAGGSLNPYYIDGLQFENLDHPTTYIDGDQLPMTIGRDEYFWDGSPHESTSYRIADTRAGGREVFFTDLGFDVMGVQGLGHPPVANVSNQMNSGGSSYQNTVVVERTFTLAGTIQSGKDTMPGLMDIRADLIDALSPFSTAVMQPLKIGYHDIRNCIEVKEPIYFVCSYVSGLEGIVDNPAQERVNLVFTEWQPCGYEDGEKAVEVSPRDVITGLDFIIRRNNDTGVWESVVTTDPNAAVYAVAEGLDGTIYFGGAFTSFGGVAVNRICSYDPSTKAITAMGAGADAVVRSIAVGSDGMVYIGGDFVNVNGAAANGIAKWNPTTSTWSYFTVGANTGVAGGGADVYSVVITASNTLVIGGDFTSATGVAVNHVAQWTGATFAVMGAGVNNIVRGMCLDSNGDRVWIVGLFTTANGIAVPRIARYNFDLATWSTNVGTGISTVATTMDGIYGICRTKSGYFYIIASDTIAPAAYWIFKRVGSTWISIGWDTTWGTNAINPAYNSDSIYIAGTAAASGLFSSGQLIYNGSVLSSFDAHVSGATNIQTHYDTKKWLYVCTGGNMDFASTVDYTDISNRLRAHEVARPLLEVHGPAVVYRFENRKAGKVCRFDCALALGETAYLNYDPYNLNFYTDAGVNMLSHLVSPSSLIGMDFRRAYADAGVYLGGDECWVETGDGSNQIGSWDGVSGVTFANSYNHTLYGWIVANGGGFYHLELYKDAGLGGGDIVAHTGAYNFAATLPLVEDNNSGIGGCVEITAVVGEDNSISVTFGYGYLRWRPMYHSIDEAMR